jgi:putative membrane-bound dehydrogenase-like protein
MTANHFLKRSPRRTKIFLLIISILLLSSFSFISYNYLIDGKTPEESLADLQVADGLEVQLFASEPMITNPTNIDVDSKGRVWVCEGFNYRNSLNPKNPVDEKGDRIVVLEDTDGDGKADKSKVFYQGTDVNAALGIAVLGNKVYISSSPHIFIFTDENGDDVADKKEILFSGLKGVDHDHGTHSMTFGPDGKLYFTLGNEGKVIKDKEGNILKDKEGTAIETTGQPFRDGLALRCNLDGSQLEVIGHNFRNNYESAPDAFGTVWQSDNDDDGNRGVRINYVMEGGNFGYKDEMTGAFWSTSRTNMEEEIPRRHWHLNDPGVVPNLLQTGAGSPTGLLVYEGDLLPKEYQNQVIHCDAGQNVVRAYPVTEKGAGYEATILPILKSKSDQWFRPSDVSVAPDGSLIIADWYDPGVGGHQMKDPKAGRIYRVAPPKHPYKMPAVNLASSDGAAQALKSPNLATRYLAFTKLKSGGKAAEKALLPLWKDPNPRVRAKALWLLAPLDKKYLKAALADKDQNIRIQGIRIVKQNGGDLIATVKQMINDPSVQVRRELVLALRHSKSPEAAELWSNLALRHDGEDRWYLEALGIGADKNWEIFFPVWEKKVGNDWNSKAGKDIIWRARNKEAMPYLAKLINDQSISYPEKLRYFRAFDFHTDPSKQQILASLLQSLPKDAIELRKHVYGQMEIKNETVNAAFLSDLNYTLDKIKGQSEFMTIVKKFKLIDRTNDLVDIVAKDPYSGLALEAGYAVIGFDQSEVLKAKIIGSDKKTATGILRVLGRIEGEKSRGILQSVFMDSNADPDLRRLAISGYGTGWSGEEALVALLNSKKLPADLEKEAAMKLLYAGRENIKNEGAKYLATSSNTQSFPSVDELVKKKGDAVQGKLIFERACVACHQVNGMGINFGPDLSEIGTKLPKEALLYSIMDPNAGISFGYEGYKVEIKNGETAVGIIASETETNLDVKKPGGVVSSYTKSQVKSKEQLKASLMPNLTMTMKPQELVDLVEYLSKQEKKAKPN